MKKIIGIAGNLKINKEDSIFIGEMHQYTTDDYVKAVIQGGGIPVIIPVMDEIKDIEEIVKYVDGIILTGGYDIDPQLYNESPIHELGFVMRNVDDFYMNVMRCADNFNKPIIGDL